MNKISLALAVVAIVIAGFALLETGKLPSFGSTDCTTTTCLSGGLAVTSGNLSVDSGTAAVSGAATLSSTLAVTATTTLSDTVNFNNPGLCINFYATSTATRLHLTASTTPTLPKGAAAVMTANYGACAK